MLCCNFIHWCVESLTPSPTEAEQFVEINTQKLSENKYLCPLSGKKFKGPEFVRKHIFNKHLDKVEAVKKEVGWLVGRLVVVVFSRPMPTKDLCTCVTRLELLCVHKVAGLSVVVFNSSVFPQGNCVGVIMGVAICVMSQ